jgi:hypothetical protein
MRRFWLFRSNIKELEYYHQYKDLETFEKNCHDYYMLLPLWLLQHDYFDEVTIWRLSNKVLPDIVFDINGKKYIQKWVSNFLQTTYEPKSDMSFFRGGFQEYDQVTKVNPDHFGVKLYLGAGRRITPQWGGKYDVLLMEDESDFVKGKKCLPFYKTASPNVFYSYVNKIVNLHWDICWPCNFTQLKYKGQKYFIKKIAQSEMFSRLKIIHCGNKAKVGEKICREYGVDNIAFMGHVDRTRLNQILNHSLFGLNLSNRVDGCPRVSTEILMSGTPLIIRDSTRLLPYYKGRGVIEVNDGNIVEKILMGIEDHSRYKAEILMAINEELSYDNINKKNIDLWKKI